MTALCPVSGSKNLLLAGTLHRCVYYVDSEVTPAGDPRSFSMPNQRMLDELLNKIQELDNINKLMSKEDSYLKAISLTTRAHLLKGAFNVNVKVFTGVYTLSTDAYCVLRVYACVFVCYRLGVNNKITG